MICVILTQGKHAIINSDDWDLIKTHKWFAYKNGNNFYAATQIPIGKRKQRMLGMHRVIIGSHDKKYVVDHIDGNGLNNTRENLRLCKPQENSKNSSIRKTNKSGFKGVDFHKGSKKWRAQISSNGKKIHIGYFDTPINAHKAYCEFAKKHHQEFANFGHFSSIS